MNPPGEALESTAPRREPPVGAQQERPPPESFDGYILLRPIGQGGMGRVYLGHDTLLDRPVAVKFVDGVEDDERRERFFVEARAIARLQHPNVVAVHRVGEVEGLPYLVNEFVRGQSLDRVKLPLPPGQLLSVALGLARGLAAAHRRGVLHRDIKPANAILSDDGEVKLLDFGLAKLVEEAPPPQGPLALAGAAGPVLDDAEVDPVARTRASVPPSRPVTMPPEARPPSLPPGWAPASVSAGGSARPPSSNPPVALSITRAGTWMGTPLYMAPEVWLGEPATYRSDVYSLGVLLYHLCSGRTPFEASTMPALRERVLTGRARPLPEELDRRLAAVIDRCLERDPARRYEGGEAVRDALLALAGADRGAAAPAGNPYRGLHAFEAEHRALFFGRDAEVRTVLERLRTEPLVVVSGPSGVGKSSLCRAGVGPWVAQGALGGPRRWQVVSLTPGRHPATALAAALAAELGLDERELLERQRSDPAGLCRELRKAQGRAGGLLLLVDQLEELATLSDPTEARQVAELLGWLATPTPGLRLLCTVRGDFLVRLGELPGLGELAARALHLLGPLDEAAVREAVIGPARTQGVFFESETLVAELVAAAAGEGGLPLLQFALAQLWEARDVERRLIPEAALASLGGVEGALARHADGVLAGLLPAERAAACALLPRLVTADGTRARRSEAELGAAGPRGADARAALDALVRGRLLVARGEGEQGRDRDPEGSSYEVAHEALLRGWPRLRALLDADAGRRQVRERLAAAAAEWERLGRARELLWGARQLAELPSAEAGELDGLERAFAKASRLALRGRRLRAAVFAALALGASALALGAVRQQALAGLEAALAAHRGEADRAEALASSLAVAEAAARGRAFAAFDRGAAPEGEAAWAEALAQGERADRALGEAARALEAALAVRSLDPALRARLGEVLYARALRAERDQQGPALDELLARLALYDDGGALRQRWASPARLALAVRPAGARLSLTRYAGEGARRRAEPLSEGLAPTELSLAPGSYLLELAAPGRATVRYPLVLERGGSARVELELPRAGAVPEGMVYVPEGDYRFGSAAAEGLRRDFFHAAPLHVAHTGAYLIGRTEVTFGDYLAYLQALPAAEARRRAPHLEAQGFGGGLSLVREAGGYRLRIRPAGRDLQALEGEPLHLPARRLRAEQDWRRWPVVGISLEDAQAYAAWLDRSGRLPGARLCTEAEWERAARGADDREYPHGDRLEADDANHDATYGKDPLAQGPDEVGSHPGSRSPFGVDDLAGNVWEWTRSVLAPGEAVVRGGSFAFGQNSARSSNREVVEPAFRDVALGMRLCAEPPGQAFAPLAFERLARERERYRAP